MENQIFKVTAGMGRSLMLKEHEIWIHGDNVKKIEKFEKAINKTGSFLRTGAYKISYTSVREISYNESSEFIKLHYINDKGKEKKLKIDFSDTKLSNRFGKYLGKKLEMRKIITQEDQMKPLFLNVLYVLMAIAATYLLSTVDATTEISDSGSRKTRNKAALLKLVVDTIGQTGVLIIGGLTTLFFIYQLYKRFKNPSNEVVFTK